jgi:hypothetical protein
MVGNTAYVAAGVGRVYACGLGFFGVTSPKLEIGGDLNGTMPLTNDKHLYLESRSSLFQGREGW